MRERRFGEKGGVGVTRIQMSTPEASSSGNRVAEWETSTDEVRFDLCIEVLFGATNVYAVYRDCLYTAYAVCIER